MKGTFAVLDYKSKIIEKWPVVNGTRRERSAAIRRWLNEKDPELLANEDYNIAAELVMREAVGDRAYDSMTVELAESAEKFIQDYYLEEEK